MYEELKDWQSGLGALIGFLALILAAQRHFKLNRQRDHELREQETLSVMAALYGEILLLRNDAARLAEGVANAYVARGTQRHPTIKFDQHFLDANKLSDPLLYKALAPKLGLLPADLVIAVTQFHNNFESARSWLPLLVDDDTRGYRHSVLYVLIPARDAVRTIVPALRRMETFLSIAEPAGDPDLNMTDSVIDLEEHP